MSKLKVVFVMIIWGSIGVFTRYIDTSPILLAFMRAVIAIPVLVVFGVVTKSLSYKNVTFKEIYPYIISGVLMAFAWLTLFFAFKNTNISTAIIAYNMCPVYVLLLAPLILKEKLRNNHIITVFLDSVRIIGVNS